jgi:hypothetical protein
VNRLRSIGQITDRRIGVPLEGCGDITPYPERMHRPLPGTGSAVLFLLDGTALPVVTSHQIAPLPLRFFALGDDDALAAYVKRLNDNEQEKCRRIYEAGQAT